MAQDPNTGKYFALKVSEKTVWKWLLLFIAEDPNKFKTALKSIIEPDK